MSSRGYPETMDAADYDAPYWVVSTAYKDTTSTVHIPSEESTRDKPRAMCSKLVASKSVKAKETSVYPAGFRTVCRECLYMEECR